jgi:hypothetical protein
MGPTTRISEALRVRLVTAALVLAALATQLSCASSPAPEGGPRPQPAARMALAPEYRLFYDALQDYGDWVLIQPYGYVFRPRNNIVGWQPYLDGFWAANDLYGWVWVSAEPFGWATYHYGSWLYDQYDGWVWVPGRDWGPGWVTWEQSDDYVGWAPAFARGSNPMIAGGAFVYAPLNALGSADLPSHVVPKEKVAVARQGAQRIENTTAVGGVVINRGPSFEEVARAGGYVGHVGIDVMGPATAPGAAKPGKAPAVPNPAVDETRRAAEEAARQAQQMIQNGGQAPARVPVVRPGGKQEHAPQAPKPGSPEHPTGKAAPEQHPQGKAPEPPAGKAAPPDSSRQ